MKLQILDEEAKDLTHAQTTFPHQQDHTAKLKIVNRRQEGGKVSILDDFRTFLWLFEPDDASGRLSAARVDEEGLEPTEAIGNLLVEHRVAQRFTVLKLIAVETTHGCDNGIHTAFAERTGFLKRTGIDLPKRIAQPLDEADQVVRGNVLPVKMSLF